jgi:hypothetical protein
VRSLDDGAPAMAQRVRTTLLWLRDALEAAEAARSVTVAQEDAPLDTYVRAYAAAYGSLRQSVRMAVDELAGTGLLEPWADCGERP